MAKQPRRVPAVRIAARINRADAELDRRDRMADLADQARRAEATHAAKFWHRTGADAPAINGLTVTRPLATALTRRRSQP